MAIKKVNSFSIAVFLSTTSLAFGILREFLLVALLGFSSSNDQLQLPLSIFYTIGISIDAMRLSCLNLYTILPLEKILACASIVIIPLILIIGFTLNYTTTGMPPLILAIAMIGSYFNLIAALLITYKQRNNVFLPAQIINVLPNFILIPGVVICYWLPTTLIIITIVGLTSIIPIIQCILLLLLPNNDKTSALRNDLSYFASMSIFLRHLSAQIGEQFFQIVVRAAFLRFGAGFLSLFAFSVRIYMAARFILIDSFIGSKLSTWNKDSTEEYYLHKLINSSLITHMIVFIGFIIAWYDSSHLTLTALQMALIFMLSFYFSTLVRIIYFKINHSELNNNLVTNFALYELLAAVIAYGFILQQPNHLLVLLWIGYIVKPCAQLFLLRTNFAVATE